MVTDAKSLFDHLSTTGSVLKKRQTLVDLLITRELVENKAVIMRWVPTTHMLADMLTKSMTPIEAAQRFLSEETYSLTPSQEKEEEEHRKSLRQGQRARSKERNKE